MKSVAEIMNELGFSHEASTETKEAFIRHLIKQTTGTLINTPSENRKIDSLENVSPLADRKLAAEKDDFVLDGPPSQLCFDLEDCG